MVRASRHLEVRELIAILAARDIKVRYRQALVGIVWVVLQPVVETFVFGVLFALMGAKPVSAGVPYIVSAYCGLLLWQLFASIVLSCTNSLVENRQLLTKVYFPRVVLPLSAVLRRPLVDFAVGKRGAGCAVRMVSNRTGNRDSRFTVRVLVALVAARRIRAMALRFECPLS